MTITAQQIFDLSMDLISKRNANGSIDATSTAKYKALAPGILTIWQNELAKTGDLYSKYEISSKPIISLFGSTSGFDCQEHGKTSPATDFIFETPGSCTAYSFEVDGEATVYIEDYTGAWNVLATINVPDTVTSYKNYKGIVTPTTGATKSRIRFSGAYYYKTINRALFGYPLKASQVPAYMPWVKYTMPSDFKSIDVVVTEYPDRQYAKDGNYKWEGKNEMWINYYYEGKIRVVYKPVPIPITLLSQTMQVDDISCMSGAYFLASHLLIVEDPDSASFFNQRFEELKMESNIKQPMTIQNIIDVYGVNY